MADTCTDATNSVGGADMDEEMEEVLLLCKMWEELPGESRCRVREFYFNVLQDDCVEMLECLLDAGLSPTMEFKVDMLDEGFIEILEYGDCEEEHYDPNDPIVYPGVYTALEVAISKSSERCVEFLLERGVDPSAETSHSPTPLTVVCSSEEHNCKILALLAGSGARLDCEHFLFRFALRECVECVKVLLDHGVSPDQSFDDLLHTMDSGFGSALHYLATQKSEDGLAVVKLLLEHGCDANLRDGCGETPLAKAVKIGNCDVTQTLLQHDARVQLPCVQRALLEALSYGYISCVPAVVPELDDLNYKDSDGYSCLDVAMMNCLRVYDLADVDKSVAGSSPLPCLVALLVHGAQPDKFCSSDLHDLMENPNRTVEVIAVVVNAFANLNFVPRGYQIPDENLKSNPGFYGRLQSLMRTPRSLQHLCRSRLRWYLNGKYRRVVDVLDMSVIVKRYLLFSDPGNLD